MIDTATRSRVTSQRQTILNLLHDAGQGGCTNLRLAKVSLRYTAHIAEMRSCGYEIEAQDHGEGIFNYVLTKDSPNDTPKEKAINLFFRVLEDEHDGVVSVEELKMLFDKYRLNIVRTWGANTTAG